MPSDAGPGQVSALTKDTGLAVQAPGVLCEIALQVAADAIERGDHDTIAIPRLSLGDQGAGDG